MQARAARTGSAPDTAGRRRAEPRILRLAHTARDRSHRRRRRRFAPAASSHLAAYFRPLDAGSSVSSTYAGVSRDPLGLAVAAIFGAGLVRSSSGVVQRSPTGGVARGVAIGVMGQDSWRPAVPVGVSDTALIWRYLTLNWHLDHLVFLTLRFGPDHPDRRGAELLGVRRAPPTAEPA